jgi:nitroreductase
MVGGEEVIHMATGTGDTPPAALTHERRIVELACRAPSIHNTQPWLWRIGPRVVELHADRSRQLRVADACGRSLVLSCGAALHHARVAAAGTGFDVEVVRMPDGPQADLMAVLHLTAAPITAGAVTQLEALDQRCTDRRRFTSWPVPDERLEQLAAAVTTADVIATPLTDVTKRFRTELLASRALIRQDQDPRYAAEQDEWIGGRAGDGIPVAALVPLENGPNDTPSRFVGPEPVRPPTREQVESSDGLIALTTVDDRPMSWLRCGEALSELWLSATAAGLSVVPLSQVVEVEETRSALEHEVLGRPPQILVRIGWQEISRRELPRTPRRPVNQVLLP